MPEINYLVLESTSLNQYQCQGSRKLNFVLVSHRLTVLAMDPITGIQYWALDPMRRQENFSLNIKKHKKIT